MTLDQESKSSKKSVSLPLILVIPFVLQIFAAVGIIGYLSFRNGQKAVKDLAIQLGATEYLTKPYVDKDLLNVISTIY